MRLFRRQKPSRPQFFFDQVQFKVIPVAFANELYAQMCAASDDMAWRRQFLSWLYGGITAADAFLDRPEFRALWWQHGRTEPTPAEMRGVVRVFTLAMVSRWAYYRWRERADVDAKFLADTARDVIVFFAEVALPGVNPLGLSRLATSRNAPEALRGAFTDAARKVRSSIAQDAEPLVEEFLAVHSQFVGETQAQEAGHGLDGATTFFPIEVDFVASLAARELGRELSVSVTSLNPPIGYYKLILAGWRGVFESLTADFTAHTSLTVSARAMLELCDGLANVEIR